MTTGKVDIASIYGEKALQGREDFLELAADAEHLLANRDVTDRRITELALQSVIINLGEAVKRIERDSSFVAEHPDLQLRQIALTRDHAAHSYDGFDYDLAWNALANDLPQIVLSISEFLHD